MIATTNQIAGFSREEFTTWRDSERLRLIDLVHSANDFIEDVFDNDVPLAKELRELQHLADPVEWGGRGELGELDYTVDVDVTAESCVPDVVVVGHVRCGQNRFAVVVECLTGVEKVGGKLVKKYVGRVCR